MTAPSLDQRLAARIRPDGPAAMHQTWRDLLFLHWTAHPAELAQHLPAGLHLDLFDGRAWLGIVPFLMRGVRPRRLPSVPWLSNFLELNVRTYVHDDAGAPGVWFFSLDASNPIACSIGRARFHLPYFDAKMRATEREWIDYDCQRRGTAESAVYRYRPRGEPTEASPGTLEFFLLERYDLYAHDPKTDRLFRGRVHHTPYQLQDVEVPHWSPRPIAWNGLTVPTGPPEHLCYAKQAVVEVFSLKPLRP